MKLALSAVLLLAAYSSTVSADLLALKVEAGIGEMKSDHVGWVYNGGEMSSKDSYTYLDGRLEHFLPLIPNLRIAYSEMPFSQTADVIGAPVNYTGELQEASATLYYEILDSLVNLDVGLTIKETTYSVGLNDSMTQVSFVKPLVYLNAELPLPFTGFTFGGLVEFIPRNSDVSKSYDVYLAYKFIDNPVVDLSVKLGYAHKVLNLDMPVFEGIDVTGNGVYAGLQVYF